MRDGAVPEGWELAPLGDHLDRVVGGGTPSRKRPDYWWGDIPWASVKDMAKPRLETTEETIAEAGLSSSATNLIPPGTIVLATRMAVGAVARTVRPTAINQDLKALFPKSTLSVDYLFYLMQMHGPRLALLSPGTTVSGLRLEALRALPVLLPPLAEQRKIAEVLCSVDDAIERTEAVIEQVRRAKQGLAQQLLTRGLPGRHTRFKQTEVGEIPEEWEVVPLGDCGRWMSGGTPSRAQARYWQGDIPWVSPKDMKALWLEDSEEHISPEAQEAGAPLVEPGTILMVVRGMILAHSFPVGILKRSAAFNQDVKALSCRGGLNPEFLVQVLSLRAAEFLTLVDAATHGTKRLPTEALQSVRIAVPPLEEQKIIAAALKHCDDRVIREGEALRDLRRLKSALMHVLLTGQVRVEPSAAAVAAGEGKA